jgi:hypothetical protein
MDNDKTQSSPPEYGGATGSESAVERWECNYCGKGAPCIVEIHFVRTPYPHVEAQPRFRKRTCVCGESHVTDWEQIQNKSSTGQEPA